MVYPHVLPYGVTPEFHAMYAAQHHGIPGKRQRNDPVLSDYMAFVSYMTETGWTPIAQGGRVIWAIETDGNPIRTATPLTKTDWKNRDRRAQNVPVEGLVYAFPSRTTEYLYVSTEATMLILGTPVERQWAVTLIQLLQNENERFAWLEEKHANRLLDCDVASILLEVASYPDHIGLDALTGEHDVSREVMAVVTWNPRPDLMVAALPHVAVYGHPENYLYGEMNTAFQYLVRVMFNHDIEIPYCEILEAIWSVGGDGFAYLADGDAAALICDQTPQHIVWLAVESISPLNTDRPHLLSALAKHPFTPAEFLGELAYHPSARVRQHVSENSRTPLRARAVAAIQ